jgi:hypothetical protein
MRQPAPWLDAVVPITYSVGGGVVHQRLRGYKDDPARAVRARCTRDLAAILWRFLGEHERCVAAAARAASFTLVTTVPSSAPQRDERRGRLRLIARGGDGAPARYVRLLRATGRPEAAHRFEPERFAAAERIGGADVLLIDDTWTSGASAQAAAHALKRAGARRVALVVIGRHVNPEYLDNRARLRALPPFQWSTCAAECAGSATVKRAPSPGALDTVAVPPIACVSSATIASPRPEPSPRSSGERSCR